MPKSQPSLIRVIVADDHALVRGGICSLLEKNPSVQVVAEAGDGRECLEKVRQLHPDVVFMDIAMQNLNGLEALAAIRSRYPAVKVIMLSMYDNEEYVIQALRGGASGYLLKNGAITELEAALLSAMRGEKFLTSKISQRVIEGYMARVGNNHGTEVELTARQREIVKLICNGKSTKEMAFALKLSSKTVEAHRSQLMDKLGIHDVPTLVRYAMRTGLIPPEVKPI